MKANTVKVKIFVSHLATHKIAALNLSEALELFGMDGFVAHEDIEPTKEWQRTIEQELLTMDGLIALLAEGFKESSWCDQEVGAAVGRQVPFIGIKQGIDPHGFVGKYQALQDTGLSSGDLAKRICELFLAMPEIGPKITANLVQQLVVSTSWERSRQLIRLIEKSKYLTADDKVAMQRAAINNKEVREAFDGEQMISHTIDKLTVSKRLENTDNWLRTIARWLLGLNKTTPD